MRLTKEQKERYSRHLLLQGVGVGGQKKLMESKVLVIGAGGLGSPAILYLAASGVGTIGIVDGDTVDLSNLQRQVIHSSRGLGRMKAESAGERVRELNPDVQVTVYPERVDADNILEIMEPYDFVIDGVDNFATKFLINDACVLAKKPFCHAGVGQFYGQVLTYVPGAGPCLRCILGEVPEDGGWDNSSTNGIIGSIPGILGSIQALEAQKYLTGAGNLLTGQILNFDGLVMQFRTVEVPERTKDCRVCGEKADIKELKMEEYKMTNCRM